MSCFWEMKSPIGEASEGAEGMDWDPKMEETGGASVIIEGCLD